METGGLSYYKSNKEVDSNKEKPSEPLFKVVYPIFLPSNPTAVCMTLNDWRIIYNPGVSLFYVTAYSMWFLSELWRPEYKKC